uniref:(California timema) hypothetical protein n=1 Tax=Timema californicum TaxID=61474 RepID=A0A7R9JB52_TIMCA|nr:unnamed protein product [Timema californicum]
MASESDSLRARGRRDMRDITIETYSNNSEGRQSPGLLHIPENDLLPTQTVKEPKPRSSSSCEPDCDSNAISKTKIAFVSGNPFVEITKGILHLFKENELTSMDRAAKCSQTVCILAVPANMTCHDLLTFTAACHEDINNLRIIRDGSPNQYMALLKFRTQQSASDFYSSFNGVPFNSLELDCCCHLVFVSHVELLREGEGGGLPPQNHTELPTCPTPEVVADNRCLECHSSESLWICLICGHVGCGRYVQGHAYKHYLETQHCYAMQLGNSRVWDYVGDNFVHRLLQNKGDGKLVEGNAPCKQGGDEKLDSIQLEFTYLLTSQLDSQRLYFEEKMTRLEKNTIEEAVELKDKAVKVMESNQILQDKINTLTREKQITEKKLQQTSNRLTLVQSELNDERQMSQAFQRNLTVWQTKFKALEDQFQGFKQAKDGELAEVKEQLRDVMFYLEAQKQISESADRDEIAEGHIVIGEPSKPASDSKSRRRRKHH